MIQVLLIPIIAICQFKASPKHLKEVVKTSQTKIERELNIEPKLTGYYRAVTYVYAISNTHVYISANSRLDTKQINVSKLSKVPEVNCKPLFKNEEL